jgi:hypothetical protein
MEVHYCASYLVSTLAQGYGAIASSGATVHNIKPAAALAEMTEQAFELACPIDDWEEAAFQAGWSLRYRMQDDPYFFHEEHGESDIDADAVEPWHWQDLCEQFDIDPYQREVFEHWIVSDWLADQLEARGEKVDRDFAGMIVWARTTSGQGIASDSVITAIAADLNRAA